VSFNVGGYVRNVGVTVYLRDINTTSVAFRSH